MNTANISQTCPLCEKDKHMGSKAKQLYGHLVCRKCLRAFVMRRLLAYFIDWFFLSFFSLLLEELFTSPSIISFVHELLILSLMFVMRDGLISGSSPGKRIFELQVVDKTTGKPIGFGASFKRNLPLLIPFMPLIVLFQLHRGERVGDGWANTRVIWEKYKDKAPFAISNVG